jgi:hypothetical protein
MAFSALASKFYIFSPAIFMTCRARLPRLLRLVMHIIGWCRMFRLGRSKNASRENQTGQK